MTSDGINREISSVLECAWLNRENYLQSLAIPETALVFLTKQCLAELSVPGFSNRCGGFLPDTKTVLRGILPSLQYVVHRHSNAVKTAQCWKAEEGEKGKVNIDTKPNSKLSVFLTWFGFSTIA